MNYVLADFDNHIMNGFEFCKKAYSFFEGIRRSPKGVERLRLRKGKLEKKLIEELLPIAQYLQACYSRGRQLKVRWKDGTQNYDARLLSSGYLVDIGEEPKRHYVEVTTAVHENDHIERDIVNKTGGSFGVKGIKKNLQTGKYESQPYCYTNSELSEDLADKIAERITAKAKIKYPPNTTLIIQCFLDMPILLDGEWEKAIENVKGRDVQHKFREIFVFDANHRHVAILYGNVRSRKRRQNKHI